MFRILADFDYDIPRTESNMHNFAQLMIQQAHDSGAKPLAESAIISLLEHSCRLAEHQQRLSAHINDALEIIGEANFLCQSAEIDSAVIEQALSAREYRNGRIAQSISGRNAGWNDLN